MAIKILFSLFTLRMVICPRSSDNDTISEFANLLYLNEGKITVQMKQV